MNRNNEFGFDPDEYKRQMDLIASNHEIKVPLMMALEIHAFIKAHEPIAPEVSPDHRAIYVAPVVLSHSLAQVIQENHYKNVSGLTQYKELSEKFLKEIALLKATIHKIGLQNEK